MLGISTDIAVTGALAAVVYAVAAFAQLVVGRLIDRRAVKPILIFVAAGQPVFLGLMVLQQDYILFVVTLLAMGFVFGQIPDYRCGFIPLCTRSMENQGAFGQIHAQFADRDLSFGHRTLDAFGWSRI